MLFGSKAYRVPFEKNVEMRKQNVMTASEYSNRNMNVTLGSVYVMTARSPTFMWKKKVIIATDISMNTENLKYQADQCSQPFIPISFIDS